LEKRAEQALPGTEGGGGAGVMVAQTMYTHMNKCKNNKKKLKSVNTLFFVPYSNISHEI
jgi:hypothetical protein